ncbi:MAG TPA: hypothetical protein VIX86_20385 [Streptosporangiaceae bacterium]
MFVWHEMPLAAGFPAAKARFALLMQGEWLDSVSQDAYSDGLSGLIRVGPFGRVPGLSKLVRVQLLEPLPRDDEVILPIRWEATGAMSRLFPVLDANLVLASDEGGRAVLRLVGSYRPPLDGVGEELDQLALHRVADATIRSLLRRIADPLGETPATGQLGPPAGD